MKGHESRRFRVIATYQRNRVVFNVEATTGTKAVAEARRQAKTRGMKFIMVNSVRPVEQTVISHSAEFGAPLTSLGGSYIPPDTGVSYAGEPSCGRVGFLSLDEINDRIGKVWEHMQVFVPRPDESPLKAYELEGRFFLDDGLSGRQELLSRSSVELVLMIYEWATYTGYCSDDFDVFVENCWE